MIRTTALAMTTALAFAPAALAQSAQPGTPDADNGGRYSFHRVDEGYLRLDLQTGYVSLCSRHTIGWTCQTIADERIALEAEIERLQADNSALKKELLAHGLPLPGKIKEDLKPDVSRVEPSKRETAKNEADKDAADQNALAKNNAAKNEPEQNAAPKIEAPKNEIAKVETPKNEPPAAKPAQPELKLPSQADLGRMKALVEDAWRRLVDMIHQLQKDTLQKT